MNNYLGFYYNLYPKTIYGKDNYHYFFINNQKYCLLPCNYLTNPNDIYLLNNNMLKNNIRVHEIIPDKNGQIITKINNNQYMLLRIRIDDNIKINDDLIMHFNKITKYIFVENVTNNWAKLWGEKIDYFEYQIEQNSRKYPAIYEISAYYIGLSENAISYINDTQKEYGNNINSNQIVHKRIGETLFDLYNPLNLIVDNKVRDISDYIKTNFFKGISIFDHLQDYFDDEMLTPYDLRMLYGRLLFPTYFFDVCESIMQGLSDENKIINITNKASEYETLLKKIYLFISKYYSIPPINWLNKKTSN